MRVLILCVMIAGCGGNIGGKWMRFDCPDVAMDCVRWAHAN